ncbi:carbohydrate ABC transporter permease [Thalassovita taeanensis]|uniref:Carbohydrate ABC transporter membrane protein 1, CUT1 family (TC 3.A.1.1.-) n=1 Tax=Thalassovita taeanensis TaxID=657014 RepID=A0A1H9HDR2_9RHOB|nr:sugar ABC transporter permease [Thalassovita taeanensis]SEQ60479.1 carbohydrate ABC transporter membrane protein 1, CUT1 family (TC 3.A.1.1.-) [Thalassovita taeanensis]
MSRAYLWFIGPALFLMFALLIVPILVAFGLSLTNYSLGNSGAGFVGLDNYADLFGRSSYIKMFKASLTYVLIVVPASVGLGLGAALLITSVKRFGDLYKTVFFLPVMAALLAMAIAWEFTLNPSIGVVNRALEAGCGTMLETWTWYADGCANSFPLWLGDKRYAMGSIAFIGIWQAFGFNMVLYLAGLTGVSRTLYDAAEMDGALSAWEKFRLVTWPMLGPTNVFVITITTIRSFQVFDTVEALTRGGPSKSTYVMMYAIYEKAIKQNLLGIGTAITVVFLAFVLIVTLVQRWLIERKVHYA